VKTPIGQFPHDVHKIANFRKVVSLDFAADFSVAEKPTLKLNWNKATCINVLSVGSGFLFNGIKARIIVKYSRIYIR
jgi:hypothetical protein